jgi:Fur family ferric uptake transcriptional regulator
MATATRETRQGLAIRQVLESANRPLTPEDVLASAQRAVPGLGMATVYRRIKTLLEERRLVAVELPGQSARYEVAGKAHHHHFHCRGCDRIFELSGCVDGLRELIPRGFRVTGHDVVLYGYCRSCRKEAASGPRPA